MLYSCGACGSSEEYLRRLCLSFTNVNIKMRFISFSGRPARDVCAASSRGLEFRDWSVLPVCREWVHFTGLMVYLCGSCSGSRLQQHPAILPAVLWELA